MMTLKKINTNQNELHHHTTKQLINILTYKKSDKTSSHLHAKTGLV